MYKLAYASNAFHPTCYHTLFDSQLAFGWLCLVGSVVVLQFFYKAV